MLMMILPGLLLAGCIDKDVPKPPPRVPKPRIDATASGQPGSRQSDGSSTLQAAVTPRSAGQAQRPPATSISVP